LEYLIPHISFDQSAFQEGFDQVREAFLLQRLTINIAFIRVRMSTLYYGDNSNVLNI